MWGGVRKRLKAFRKFQEEFGRIPFILIDSVVDKTFIGCWSGKGMTVMILIYESWRTVMSV